MNVKRILRILVPCLLLLLGFSKSSAQIGNNLTLLSNWDNNNLPVYSGLVYNEVWGWVDSSGREYGIIGSLERTYIIEVTDPYAPVVRDSVAGKFNNCIHRDYKTYGNYIYAVADEGNSSLQVIDMSYLPDSVHVVFDSDVFFRRCHNTFIDSVSGRLYAVGTNTQGNGVIILDLATNPEVPSLLASHNLGVYTHDLYVRGDTAYMNNGPAGMAIYDFSNVNSPAMIGLLSLYSQQGYNHSCWLSDDGNSLVMLDETRNISCKVVDVSNLNNINIASMFRSALQFPDTGSIAHNPLIVGNYATISYYHDGVQIWDISNPAAPVHVAGYDTYPNNTNYNGWFGAWGVYPFFPSGTIIVSDVLNGLFAFRAPFPFPHPLTAQAQIIPATCGNLNNANGSATVQGAGGTAPYTYLWSTGDTTNSISGLAPGSYSVTISDRYGFDVVQTLNITGPSAIQTSTVVTNESCSGTANGAIDLTVTGGVGNYSYLWNTGDMIQDLNGLTAGWYYVTVTDGSGCSVIDSAVVSSLSPTPTAIAGQDSFICNTSIQLWGQAPAFGSGQWQIVNGTGNILNPSQPTSTVSNLQVGINRLVWIVTAGQCANADTVQLSVSSAAHVEAGQDTFFCGTDLQLNGSSPGFAIGNWSSGSNPINFSSISDPNAIAMGLLPGNYTATWTVLDGNCMGSDSFNISVAQGPTAAFLQSVNALTATFTDLSTNASAWFWDFGDGASSTLQNPVHSYSNNGLYNACLIVTDTCGSDTSCQQVNIFITELEEAGVFGVKVWPNPFQNAISIHIDELREAEIWLDLFDLSGKQILSRHFERDGLQFEKSIELPELAEGLYFLQLHTDQWKRSFKIMHQSK